MSARHWAEGHLNRKLFLPLAITIFSANGYQALAQTTETTQPAQAETKPANAEATSARQSAAKPKSERIEVTGSRIKRIDVEGPSPIEVIDREKIEKLGVSGVGDVLRNIAASSFGSFKESGGTVGGDVATADLRGLGSDKTLILLDGRRLPNDPVFGSPDLNLIPVAALERIEVLKDSASAIYGADAIGGVINLITKKDFSGSEFRVSQSMNTQKGGEETRISAVQGTSSDNSRMMFIMDYKKKVAIRDIDRDFNNKSLQTTSPVGSYRPVDAKGKATGPWTSANCSGGHEGTPYSPDGTNGTFCGSARDIWGDSEFASEQYTFLNKFEYDLSDDLSFYSFLQLSTKRVEGTFGPPERSALGPDQIIPATYADTMGPDGGPLPGIAAGTDVAVRMHINDLKPKSNETKAVSIGGAAGLRGSMFDGWEWDVSLQKFTVEKKETGRGYVLDDLFAEALAPENGKPYSPIDPNRDPSVIRNTVHAPWRQTGTTLQGGQVTLSGEAFGLGMSVGGSGQVERYESFRDPLSENDLTKDYAGSSGEGTRSVRSAYAEVQANPVAELEVNLAARLDHYSDFGNTVNPRVGLGYRPFSSLLLRSAYATGFKAPVLDDMHKKGGGGFLSAKDETLCREKGGAFCTEGRYFFSENPGNPDLKEEISRSFSFGAVFEPASWLNMSLDYYDIKVRNEVGVFDLDEILQMEADGRNDELASNGIIITRSLNSEGDNAVESVINPYLNLGEKQTRGIDLGLESTYKFDDQYVSLSSSASKPLTFKEKLFPGSETKDVLGKYSKASGYHPVYRLNNTVTYGIGKNSLSLSSRTVGPHRKIEDIGGFKSYTEYDAQYRLNYSEAGSLTLGVNNLMNTQGGVDEENAFGIETVDTGLYSITGRSYYMTAAYRI